VRPLILSSPLYLFLLASRTISQPIAHIHLIFPSHPFHLILSFFLSHTNLAFSPASMRVVKYFCYEGSFLVRLFRIRTHKLRGIRKIQHSQSAKCVFIFTLSLFPCLITPSFVFYYTPIYVPPFFILPFPHLASTSSTCKIGRIHMHPRDTATDGMSKNSVTIEPRRN
jgi:hypothetical protein